MHNRYHMCPINNHDQNYRFILKYCVLFTFIIIYKDFYILIFQQCISKTTLIVYIIYIILLSICYRISNSCKVKRPSTYFRPWEIKYQLHVHLLYLLKIYSIYYLNLFNQFYHLHIW